MEVSSKRLENRRLLRRAAALGPVLAPLAVAAAAAVLVAAQPVRSPWWVYADADGTYSASALAIATGAHSSYFDHPGLPTQEALALSFGAISLAHGGPHRAFADTWMLHLDRARPVFRGWAIAFFISGALLCYLLLSRLLGHWSWGLAGGLLWLAQPDLTDSIQIRPDVLLAALSLLACWAVVRAWERRSAGLFALAAAIVGFAVMTKLHAVAVLPALLLGTVLAHPAPGWWPRTIEAARSFVQRHRLLVALAAAIWLACFVVLNRSHFTVVARHTHAGKVGIALFLAFDYAIATFFVHRVAGTRALRRVFDPLYLLLGAAFAVGLAVPLSLVLSDSVHVLAATLDSLVGSNVNAGIQAFGEPLARYGDFPLLEAVGVFCAAAAATVVGIRRRNAWPALFFVASGTAAALATARLGELRYYALPYVLAIPPALWLFRSGRTRVAPLLVWPLVALVVVPTFVHMRDASHAASNERAQARAADTLAGRLLRPGQLALAPAYFPAADTRWAGLVQDFVASAPSTYPYRLVPDYPRDVERIASGGTRLRYYIGPAALGVTAPGTLALTSGTYRVAPVAGGRDFASTGIGAVRLLSGPGT